MEDKTNLSFLSLLLRREQQRKLLYLATAIIS